MCSFLFSTRIPKDLSFNELMKLRGPDATKITDVDGFYYCHNLLSMNGEFTPQPLILHQDEICILFNGEIYNCPQFYKSDIYFIADIYKKNSENFALGLDGEFAIVIVDFKRKVIIAASDCFRTKPLSMAIENNIISLATYQSALKLIGHEKISQFPANRTTVFDFQGKELYSSANFGFNLEQYKESLDDWKTAFKNSILKRTQNYKGKLFIGLSSGYDSGAIAAQLIENKHSFDCYTIVGREHQDTLDSRKKIIEKHNNSVNYLTVTTSNLDWSKNWVQNNVENFPYQNRSDDGTISDFGKTVHSDNASLLLSLICREAHKKNCKVYLSGSGADEILSDYGFGGRKIFGHSNFGGKFPKDLSDIFPWGSFYGSTQASYLAKEENVAGSFGMEARYPFLDYYVVQEYLSICSEIKNSRYKIVLADMFEELNFPFDENSKIGLGLVGK